MCDEEGCEPTPMCILINLDFSGRWTATAGGRLVPSLSAYVPNPLRTMSDMDCLCHLARTLRTCFGFQLPSDLFDAAIKLPSADVRVMLHRPPGAAGAHRVLLSTGCHGFAAPLATHPHVSLLTHACCRTTSVLDWHAESDTHAESNILQTCPGCALSFQRLAVRLKRHADRVLGAPGDHTRHDFLTKPEMSAKLSETITRAAKAEMRVARLEGLLCPADDKALADVTLRIGTSLSPTRLRLCPVTGRRSRPYVRT